MLTEALFKGLRGQALVVVKPGHSEFYWQSPGQKVKREGTAVIGVTEREASGRVVIKDSQGSTHFVTRPWKFVTAPGARVAVKLDPKGGSGEVVAQLGSSQ